MENGLTLGRRPPSKRTHGGDSLRGIDPMGPIGFAPRMLAPLPVMPSYIPEPDESYNSPDDPEVFMNAMFLLGLSNNELKNSLRTVSKLINNRPLIKPKRTLAEVEQIYLKHSQDVEEQWLVNRNRKKMRKARQKGDLVDADGNSLPDDESLPPKKKRKTQTAADEESGQENYDTSSPEMGIHGGTDNENTAGNPYSRWESGNFVSSDDWRARQEAFDQSTEMKRGKKREREDGEGGEGSASKKAKKGGAGGAANGKKRVERKRATKDQVVLLEELFARDTFPPTAELEKLAVQLDMTLKKVKNWFQNKRAKERRTRASLAAAKASTSSSAS